MNQREIEVLLKRAKRRERIFLAIAVVVAIGSLFAIYAISPNSGQLNSQEEYNLLNPARKLYQSEDLIINFQSLRDYINDKYQANIDVSIYFEYLNTGASIVINKDASFWPASLLKVPIAMSAARKIENGDWKWDDKLVLTASDKDERFGELYKQPIGSVFTIEELVKSSIKDSDNTANSILLRNLEVEEIEQIYNHIGLQGFFNESGEIGAKRYSIIFRALYNSSYISEANSQKLLSYLSETEFKEYLDSGIPKEVAYAHKIGVDKDKGVYLDSGIVYASHRPYLLTVMVKSSDEQEVKGIMKDVSEQVYKYVSEYKE